jgi:MFS transporter, ACS family, D-galactonate transporter
MRWRIVPMLMLFAALAHFNRVSISVAGTDKIIRKDYITPTQMGAVYSAFLVLYTLFMTPGGWFIDRFGPRVAWLVVGFGSALGVALTGLVGLKYTEPAALLVGLFIVRSLLGAVYAPLHPAGARLAATWIPPSSVALVNGLITGSACVGIALTYPLFGALTDRLGWQSACLVAAAFTFLIAVAWAVVGSDHPPGAPERDAAGRSPPSRFLSVAWLEEWARNRSLVYLTISYAMFGYFQYLFFYWAQFYFEDVLHLSKGTSRLNSSLLTLAMAGGMVVGGWLSDRAKVKFGLRWGLAVVPVAGMVLGALASAVGPLFRDAAATTACFAVAMAAVGSAEGSYWTAAVRLGGRRGGTAAAILNTGGNAGGLLSPFLTPWIAEHFGWQAGLAVSSAVCFAGAVYWLGVNPAVVPGETGPLVEGVT